MIFAAIADIHGNCAALEAVLADIQKQGIEDVVNLGDCFSGPLEAGWTADVLLKNWVPTVRGNHDRALIDRAYEEMGGWERPAYQQLSPEHFDWLHTLPFSMVYKDEVFCCHGSPKDDNQYWLETVSADGIMHLRLLSEIEALAEGVDQALILCGHTHIPRSVQLSDGRLIVNPGSVGCPGYTDNEPVFHKVETATPFASYAVLEKTSRGWQPTFRQVRYDNLAMAELARNKGMDGFANALTGGWLK